MAINDYLERIDDLLEEAWNLPLMGNKRMLDVQKIRDILDEIRRELPEELKSAKRIVDDREEILTEAKAEAQDIVKRAESRAKQMISSEEIVKTAKAKATEMLSETQTQTKEMERAAITFSENALKKSEDALLIALNEVKSTRMAMRNRTNKKGAKTSEE